MLGAEDSDRRLMRSDVDAILRLEVPILVVLGERLMKVSEITSLLPGSIIELPKAADEELELLVNNKPIGSGSAVKVGENFGLRITYIGDMKNRIIALGDTTASGHADAGQAAP